MTGGRCMNKNSLTYRLKRAGLGLLLALALQQSGYAGQSVNLRNRYIGNSNFPSQPRGNPWRIEMYIHNWEAAANTRIADLSALGGQIRIFSLASGEVILAPAGYLWHSAESNGCLFRLDQLPQKGVYLRMQRDPANSRLYCEVWDVNGQRFGNHTVTFTAGGTYAENGIFLGSASPEPIDRFVGFFRVHSTLVPLNARPPVSRDDSNRLLEWKFDGSGSDSAANWNIQTLNGGSLAYAATPGQTVPTARIKSLDTPFWSDWVSIRAGYPANLDGRASYSQADSSAAVTYRWRQVDGPTTLEWDDDTSEKPEIRGAVFGTYRVELTVVDAANNQTKVENEIGAVATDTNGVVIHADPNVEKIFGPMIAFGRNPWSAADDAHLRGVQVRSAQYDTRHEPEWTTPLAGTINYDATSNPFTALRQNLAASITATSNSIQLNGTANLDFSKFPTLISIESPGYGGEEILICGNTGNTVQVCYDGRGYGFSNARTWNSGARVFQRKVSGMNTDFLSTFCPAGPGLSGPKVYDSGSVNVTPGSATLAGTATVWTAASSVYGGQMIRIAGTYGGGNPFVFFTTIQSIASTTQLTMSRPWPADADVGSDLSYSFVQFGQDSLAPKWTRADNTEGQTLFGVTACLSNTELFIRGGLEAVGGAQTNKQYSRLRQYWMTQGGNGTPNFYDEVLANYAMYFRSGWTKAREAARKIGDNWVKQPLFDEGWGIGTSTPRNVSMAGVVAGTMLDGREQNWYAIRKMAQTGANKINVSCDDDVRETAYMMMWLAFAAMFDPLDTGNPAEPGQRSYWKAKLDENYARDNSCRREDDSFASGFYFNTTHYPALTVTKESTAATGTGLTAAMCPVQNSGTGTIFNGSATLQSTGPNLVPQWTSPRSITLTGVRNGAPYTVSFQWQGQGATVTLAAKWLGNSGQVNWQVYSDDYVTIIASGPQDPTYGTVYSCTYNSPTSITLNRPYAGNSGTAYLYRANLAGRGQQPFMAGIKALQMMYASQGANGQTAQNYKNLAAALGNWLIQTGYDPDTGGLHYGRGFPMCEPLLEASQQGFNWRNLQCSHGTGRDDRGAARALLAEAQSAVRAAFEANPSQELKTLGDQFYANQWGSDAFTPTGLARSDGLENIYATNSAFGAGKWYGFQFGVGMAHQWPAVRLGGAQPAFTVSTNINFDVSGIAGAAKARVTFTSPTGGQTVVTCSTAPCIASLDGRLGDHWVVVDYLSESDEVVSAGKPKLLKQ